MAYLLTLTWIVLPFLICHLPTHNSLAELPILETGRWSSARLSRSAAFGLTILRYFNRRFQEGQASSIHITPLEHTWVRLGRVIAMSRVATDASPPLYTRAAADIDDAASTKSGSTTYTTASSGTKRKRVVEPKFYSVRVGHRPGIYHSWNECLSQVKGFKNATCESKYFVGISRTSLKAYMKCLVKSFSSLTDAERFMAGEDPGKGTGGSSSPYKFYAVRSGRVPGIYTDWPSAQKQILGWTKPKHKCFSTRAEAQRFLGTETRPPADETETQGPENRTKMSYPNLDSLEPYASEPQSKKSKKPTVVAQGTARRSKVLPKDYAPENYEPGTGPLPPGAEDGFDPNIILSPRTGNVVYKTQAQKEATKLQAIRPTTEHTLRVHTDGSSLRNGQEGAFAGVGVFFGPNDER